MFIVNLTQYPATPDQKSAGVVDLQGDKLEALREALTFEEIPTAEEIYKRAEYVAELAVQNGLGPDDGDDPTPDAAMIGGVGGASWLIEPLIEELRQRGIKPVFAFSTREVVDEVFADRTISETEIFRHKGFVEAPNRDLAYNHQPSAV